jgi:hypothetical protein
MYVPEMESRRRSVYENAEKVYCRDVLFFRWQVRGDALPSIIG